MSEFIGKLFYLSGVVLLVIAAYGILINNMDADKFMRFIILSLICLNIRFIMVGNKLIKENRSLKRYITEIKDKINEL